MAEVYSNQAILFLFIKNGEKQEYMVEFCVFTFHNIFTAAHHVQKC